MAVRLMNGKLLVRELKDQDSHLLLKWLTNPILFQFDEGRDRAIDLQTVQDNYLSKQSSPVTGCAVEWDGQTIMNCTKDRLETAG